MAYDIVPKAVCIDCGRRYSGWGLAQMETCECGGKLVGNYPYNVLIGYVQRRDAQAEEVIQEGEAPIQEQTRFIRFLATVLKPFNVMVIRCAWCGSIMGFKRGGTRVSHGLCRKCRESNFGEGNA